MVMKVLINEKFTDKKIVISAANVALNNKRHYQWIQTLLAIKYIWRHLFIYLLVCIGDCVQMSITFYLLFPAIILIVAGSGIFSDGKYKIMSLKKP